MVPQKKFALICTTKNLDKNITTYKSIAKILRSMGLEMYQPWIIDNYPIGQIELERKAKYLTHDIEELIRSTDLIVAEFSEKSRSVLLQTIIALEHDIPTICLIKEEKYKNFPENLLINKKELLTIKTYKNNKNIKSILKNYVENLEPPQSKFNTVLKSSTLKQIKLLCDELNISNEELIRRAVAKEYRRIFGN